MVRAEMLAAGNGDALLVEYGDPDDPCRLLVDGGPWNSYDALRARIERLPPGGRHFELLVVTHIDGDHIDGIVRLLDDEDLGASFDQVWFNGYRHISRILAPKMGEVLSGLISARNIPWNSSFDRDAVVAGEEGALPSINLPGGARCTILSPLPRNLTRLAVVWETDPEIRESRVVPGTAEAARTIAERDRRMGSLRQLLGADRIDVRSLLEARFEPDTSPANASSIAFLLEYEGRCCLFGADATSPVLEATLGRLLEERGVQALPLDLFKLPHHGSRKNVSREILRLAPATRYLFSTNGARHSHPDREAVARVITSTRGTATLFFNYRTTFTEPWEDEALMNDYGYGVVYPEPDQVGLCVELSGPAAGRVILGDGHGDV